MLLENEKKGNTPSSQAVWGLYLKQERGDITMYQGFAHFGIIAGAFHVIATVLGLAFLYCISRSLKRIANHFEKPTNS
jgi:hypothetical protein